MKNQQILKLSLCSALLGAAAGISASAAAQEFPSKPITIQMPTPAGSTFDVILRLMQGPFQAATGKTFVLNPAIGGGGTIAPGSLLRAEPDGHTVAITYAAPMTLSPLTMEKAPYDAIRDFASVSLMTRHGILFVANPKFPANNLTETIALAKAKPGTVSIGLTGAGTLVAIIQMGTAAGVKFLEVPYKGSDQHQLAAIAGQIDMASSTVGLALENIKAGKLKAVFIGTKNRSPLLPNVPSISETLPNVEAVSWYALLAPQKTPADRVNWLNKEFNAAMKDPKVVDLIVNKNGYDVVASTPAELTNVMKTELAANARIVKEYNIKE